MRRAAGWPSRASRHIRSGRNMRPHAQPWAARCGTCPSCPRCPSSFRTCALARTGWCGVRSPSRRPASSGTRSYASSAAAVSAPASCPSPVPRTVPGTKPRSRRVTRRAQVGICRKIVCTAGARHGAWHRRSNRLIKRSLWSATTLVSCTVPGTKATQSQATDDPHLEPPIQLDPNGAENVERNAREDHRLRELAGMFFEWTPAKGACMRRRIQPCALPSRSYSSPSC